MTAEYKKTFLLNVLYIGSVLGIAVIVSKFMFAYLFPFIIGVTVALIVQKPAGKISAKFHMTKPVCAVILTVLICVVVFAAAALLLWVLGGRITVFIGKVPEYIEAIRNVFERVKINITDNAGVPGGADARQVESLISGAFNGFITRVMNFISNTAASFFKGIPAFLISSIVTVVASCYIAKDFDRLKKFVLGIVPRDSAKKLVRIKSIITDNTVKFFKGYGIIAIITFIELSALFAVLGIEKPVLKALLVSLVDALPVLGVGTVMLPWSVTALLQHDYYVGFGMLIGYAVIMVIRNFIEPKIIGGQIGINPIFTLLAMFLGLKISGIAGMLLFPLALTVVVEYYKQDMLSDKTAVPA